MYRLAKRRNELRPWHRLSRCFRVPVKRWREGMKSGQAITPAKRKRLLKTFGSCPAGYTHDDLERLLDLLYGMFTDVYTMAQPRHIVVSDPVDHSEQPRQLKLVQFTD